MQLKQNAKRGARGERAEGSDAAPGNDFGNVLGARAPIPHMIAPVPTMLSPMPSRRRPKSRSARQTSAKE